MNHLTETLRAFRTSCCAGQDSCCAGQVSLCADEASCHAGQASRCASRTSRRAPRRVLTSVAVVLSSIALLGAGAFAFAGEGFSGSLSGSGSNISGSLSVSTGGAGETGGAGGAGGSGGTAGAGSASFGSANSGSASSGGANSGSSYMGSWSGSSSTGSGGTSDTGSYSHSGHHDSSVRYVSLIDTPPAQYDHSKYDSQDRSTSYYDKNGKLIKTVSLAWLDRLQIGGGSRSNAAGQSPQELAVTIRALIKGPDTVKITPVGTQLIEKDTYAQVEAKPQTIRIPFGEATVEIQVKPEKFTWDWNDGHQTTSDNPGADWPVGEVKHGYRKPGKYQVSCRVHWRAQWKILGDPDGPLAQALREINGEKPSGSGTNAANSNATDEVYKPGEKPRQTKKLAEGKVQGKLYTDAKSPEFQAKYSSPFM